jgi:hypothetical protein
MAYVTGGTAGSSFTYPWILLALRHGTPRLEALTFHPSHVPAFTPEDMQTYLQGAPSGSLGLTLSVQPHHVHPFIPTGLQS